MRNEAEAPPTPNIIANPSPMVPTVAAVADMVADKVAVAATDKMKALMAVDHNGVLRDPPTINFGQAAVVDMVAPLVADRVAVAATDKMKALMAAADNMKGDTTTPIRPRRDATPLPDPRDVLSPPPMANPSTINFGTAMQPCLRKVAGAYRWSESQRAWVLW